MNKKFNFFDENDNLKVFDILNVFLNNKKDFLFITTFFFIIGSIYALNLNNIYKASSTFYPNYEQNNTDSRLESLAGIAGVNLNNQYSNEIPASLYPNLIYSTTFKSELLKKNITINNKTTTYRDYLINKPKNFISRIKLFLKSILNIFIIEKLEKLDNKDNIYIHISNEEYYLHNKLNSIINIEVNEKDGYVEISLVDNIPSVAAEITKIAEVLLQNKIIDFRIKNIKNVYDFTNSQVEVIKKDLYKLQDSLASFKDKNKSIKSDVFKNVERRLESEFNATRSVYNELIISKEKTKIDVERTTPIFTIINPVTLPIEKDGPNRLIIIILFTLFGVFISSLYLFVYKIT